MSTNSKVMQTMEHKGVASTDSGNRMNEGYNNRNRPYGSIKHLLERAVTGIKTELRLNIFSMIFLIIAIVIAVFFGADIAAIIS